jgi:hypothetical protein
LLPRVVGVFIALMAVALGIVARVIIEAQFVEVRVVLGICPDPPM